jgi:hypothetical protein
MWVSENQIEKEKGCCCAPIIITKFGGVFFFFGAIFKLIKYFYMF